MHLLLTVFAALVSTLLWYTLPTREQMKLGLLSLMFWGAALMWLVDAIFEYAELGAAYFTPRPLNMLNDSYLGLCVIALALVIWLVALLICDPKGVIKSKLFKNSKY